MLLASLVSMSIAGVLTSFASNVWAYAALRFVSGFVRSMVGTCSLVLSTERGGTRESPRWPLVRGRTQEAIETLQQITPLHVHGSMLDACAMPEDSGASVFATLQTMWKRKWALRRLMAAMAAHFGVGIVYFGMPLNFLPRQSRIQPLP
ncbi:hypothetical protein BAE44_0014879 [Dichanthelium oligosanthes]|uniref:Uncharacterized protein n=1 Tax=Dichanthelium oligosanthes TaxID=888268 RepID=A0A1E5VG44_9POAL|nr:hypothetical protein BAE44_0014879 [Dichanthelium oligosanthes]